MPSPSSRVETPRTPCSASWFAQVHTHTRVALNSAKLTVQSIAKLTTLGSARTRRRLLFAAKALRLSFSLSSASCFKCWPAAPACSWRRGMSIRRRSVCDCEYVRNSCSFAERSANKPLSGTFVSFFPTRAWSHRKTKSNEHDVSARMVMVVRLGQAMGPMCSVDRARSKHWTAPRTLGTLGPSTRIDVAQARTS